MARRADEPVRGSASPPLRLTGDDPSEPVQGHDVARELLLALTDATSDLVHVKDLQGRYIMVNHAVAALVGRVPAELAGLTPPEVFGASVGEALMDHDRRVLESGEPQLFEEEIVVGDEIRFYSTSKGPLLDHAGNLIGVVGISRDITDLRHLEEAVSATRDREAEDRFRLVLDSMLDLVTIQRVVRDETGAIVDFEIEYMNQVEIDVAGRSRDELVGGSVMELYPSMRDSPLFDAYVRAVVTQRPVIVDDLPWEDEIDGEQVSGFYAVQIVPSGESLIVSARDISASIRDQRQLTDAFEQLNAAQSLAHIGIWEIELPTGRVSFSDELYRIFGLEPGSALPPAAEAFERMVHPSDRGLIDGLIEQMRVTDEPVTGEIRIRRPDGSTRRLVVFGAASREPDDDAVVARLWGTAQDVTNQREAEDALRQASLSLSQEHQAVTLLQRAILPVLTEATAAEVAAVYVPAGGESQVGGDWYDAFELDDHRIGLVVGDVAGHGIPAAGLMAQLRNALRAHAFNDLGPAATLTALNRLMELTHASGFATCLYAVLDLTTLRLRWARAGHPPFMVHRGESIEVFERPDDPPIGAVAEFDYREDEIVLQTRDLLLLYTDGLIERRDEIIDVGLERLAQELARVPNLPVDVLCERLCDAMLTTGPGTDDLCVLALRVP